MPTWRVSDARLVMAVDNNVLLELGFDNGVVGETTTFPR
jgi:hypothetical protein